MAVAQFINGKGKSVRNHMVITDMRTQTTALQSYDSIVCEVVDNPGMGYDRLVRFGKNWDYSNTTTRHRNEFLRQMGLDILDTTDAVREALERGHARLDESIAVLYDETL